MADCSPGVSQQTAEVNALNSKLGLDEQFDNRREVLANDRAWEDLKLRKAQNAATFDHFSNMTAATATATALQTGQTENEQTVSPIRTGTGDAIAAVPGVAAGMVSMSGGDLAQLIAQTVAAVVPLVVGASSPAKS